MKAILLNFPLFTFTFIQLINFLNADLIQDEKDKLIKHEFISRHELKDQLENPKNFLLVVVLPLSVGLIFVSFLAVLMFGSRKGKEKRSQNILAHELVQYQSLKNAFNSLRMRQLNSQNSV